MLLTYYIHVINTLDVFESLELALKNTLNAYKFRFFFLLFNIFQFSNNPHALDHLTKDDMLAIQVLTLLGRDEELGAISVGTSIGHTQ